MKMFTRLVLFVFLTSVTLFAQIPNSDFENWTNSEPDGWSTNNSAAMGLTTVKQTTDAESGSSAAEILVGSYMGIDVGPLLSVGQAGSSGFPVTTKYLSFKGYYKFNPVQNDKFLAIVTMTNNGTVVGSGTLESASAQISYTPFTINITYNGNNIPDSCHIYFSLEAADSNSAAHSGSYAVIDNLSLSAITAVDKKGQQPLSYKLDQNYPNPFNPSTTIEYQIPQQSFVKLDVYNLLGEKVATLVNKEVPAGLYSVKFNASNLSSGVYLYELQAGTFRSVKKFILMK